MCALSRRKSERPSEALGNRGLTRVKIAAVIEKIETLISSLSLKTRVPTSFEPRVLALRCPSPLCKLGTS